MGRVVVPRCNDQPEDQPRHARWVQENDNKVRVMVVIKIGDEPLRLDLKLNGIAKELEAWAARATSRHCSAAAGLTEATRP